MCLTDISSLPSGLRTLCLAYKPLGDDEYDAWEREFHEATTLIEGREVEMERVSDELEQNLKLLGATAIEDKLQDGVPEAIADLKRAGLKVCRHLLGLFEKD